MAANEDEDELYAQLYGEDLPQEAETQALENELLDQGKQVDGTPTEAGGVVTGATAKGDASATEAATAGAGAAANQEGLGKEEEDEEDEDFDIVLGEAAGGKEGGADDSDDDLDIVLTTPGSGQPAKPGDKTLGPSGTSASAAQANSQFKWTRDGTSDATTTAMGAGAGGGHKTHPGGALVPSAPGAVPPPPPPEDNNSNKSNVGYTQMMHPNPSARPIWMPYVAPTEYKDAAFPSQAKPGQAIKLPGQTRVAPEEYKEFLNLGHGELFEVDLERVVEAAWREPGANVIDYFNYELDETSWKAYCARVKKYRLEFTMQSQIDTYGGGQGQDAYGASDMDYQADLPPELQAAFQSNDFAKAPPPQGDVQAAGGAGYGVEGTTAAAVAYVDPRSGKSIAPLSGDQLDMIKRQKESFGGNLQRGGGYAHHPRRGGWGGRGGRGGRGGGGFGGGYPPRSNWQQQHSSAPEYGAPQGNQESFEVQLTGGSSNPNPNPNPNANPNMNVKDVDAKVSVGGGGGQTYAQALGRDSSRPPPRPGYRQMDSRGERGDEGNGFRYRSRGGGAGGGGDMDGGYRRSDGGYRDRGRRDRDRDRDRDRQNRSGGGYRDRERSRGRDWDRENYTRDRERSRQRY